MSCWVGPAARQRMVPRSALALTYPWCPFFPSNSRSWVLRWYTGRGHGRVRQPWRACADWHRAACPLPPQEPPPLRHPARLLPPPPCSAPPRAPAPLREPARIPRPFPLARRSRPPARASRARRLSQACAQAARANAPKGNAPRKGGGGGGSPNLRGGGGIRRHRRVPGGRWTARSARDGAKDGRLMEGGRGDAARESQETFRGRMRERRATTRKRGTRARDGERRGGGKTRREGRC